MTKELKQRSGTTLVELERTLEAKKRENGALQADRETRIWDYESTLETIRRKKHDKENASERMRREMQQLEQELSIRQSAIDTKKKQLEMIQLERAKGREAVMRERQSVQTMRRTVLEERRRQRRQWIHRIEEIETKVPEQVRRLAEERKEKCEQATSKRSRSICRGSFFLKTFLSVRRRRTSFEANLTRSSRKKNRRTWPGLRRNRPARRGWNGDSRFSDGVCLMVTWRRKMKNRMTPRQRNTTSVLLWIRC
ncbi:OSM3-like kinesin, putative [Trypanosoma cruzi marinkellei]|uniref:OSM3-like kinesin, putative n=1 Tax=Trypanosoma cruzi marinkellei TaxID=85056 RepID=K2NHM4_TRYCR|nr:OSM3-like kinesin, putative [Trypanosoma cruzi marinkellei]